MYEPALFRVEERNELIAFLRAHPLGLLIAQGAESFSADMVPFLVDDAGLTLRAHLARQFADLTAQQEAVRLAPWAPEDAPKPYIDAQIRAIVGLEIAIDDLRGKYKLSQNRAESDRLGVLAGLAREDAPGAQSLAEMMQTTQPKDGPEAQK